MQIGQVDLNMAMIRPQDLAIMKQNENNKGMVDHAIFQNAVDKKNEEKAASVNFSPEIDTSAGQRDATEGGSNQYDGDGGRQRRQGRGEPEKQEIPVEGRVIKKSVPQFDFKV